MTDATEPVGGNECTIIKDCYVQTIRGKEQFRFRGARKCYAPWRRDPDLVLIDCTFVVKEPLP